jgi:hypothetical protein
MTILHSVCRQLDRLAVPFALIGGRAVAIRGYPRSTFDYDFLTADPRVLARDTWSALEDAGVVVDCRRGDLDDPVAGVARLVSPDGGRADVILTKRMWQSGVIARAEPEQVEGLALPVPRTADLILLKLAAGGAIDLQDVLVLLAIGDRAALVSEVEHHIAELDVEARAAWQRVQAEGNRPR